MNDRKNILYGLDDLIMGSRLVLASASPRRRELLSLITEDFEVVTSSAEEENTGSPDKLVMKNSLLKARDVYDALNDPGAFVIGSDTVVVLEGKILGKPHDEEEAVRMLRMLSGKRHFVYTGVSVVNAEIQESYYEETDVYFDVLSDSEIEAYVKTGDPLDKAGAYGIQTLSGKFVKKIDGDWGCVVGLPLNLTYRILKKHGIIS